MFNSNSSNNYISNKKISIFPNNQSDIGRGGSNQQNQVFFDIPSYTGFILPNQTHLKFNFIMTGRGEVQPDPKCGFHSLFQTVRVQSGDGSALLEEMNDYSALQSSLFQYTKNQSIDNKRQLYEGQCPTVDDIDLDNQSFRLFNEQPMPLGESRTTSLGKKMVEGYMPINTGLLNLNENILPVVALNGLNIELILDNAKRSLVYTHGTVGSYVVGTPLAGLDVANFPSSKIDNLASTTPQTLSLTQSNNVQPFDIGDIVYNCTNQTGSNGKIGTITSIQTQLGVENDLTENVLATKSSPALTSLMTVLEAVGSTKISVAGLQPIIDLLPPDNLGKMAENIKITIQQTVPNQPSTTEIVTVDSYDFGTGEITLKTGLGTAIVLANAPTIILMTDIRAWDIVLTGTAPGAVGSLITIKLPTGATRNCSVGVQGAVPATSYVLQLRNNSVVAQAFPAMTAGQIVTIGTGVNFTITVDKVDTPVSADDKIGFDSGDRDLNVGYNITNCQLVVTSVSPPEDYILQMDRKRRSEGGYNLDIKCFATARNNVLDKSGITSQIIQARQTRAYSILSLPLNNNNQRDMSISAFIPNIEGQESYSYIHGNHLYPNRDVDIKQRISVHTNEPDYNHGFSGIYTNEIDKAITSCGYPVRNLRNQKNHFLIGREWAKSQLGQVYNLRDEDLSLRIFYVNSPDARLFLHYICHLQRINISANNIRVVD